jgi:hypothetical protein
MNNLYGAAGLTLTILLLLVAYVFVSRPKSNTQIISQAMLLHRFNLGKKYSRKVINKTQSKMHYDKTNVKVIILDNQAYWIKESVFYTADVDEFGFIDAESTRAVDTMAMNKVQLDKMIFIVDKLTEGK